MNVADDVNKNYYYDEIISTIIDTDITEHFIISLCKLIQSLSIDKLHIIGDIFDRGPRADIIIEELMKVYYVDIQWGNHDISWMGAASGNLALIANVIRIAMRYNSFDLLEDGYGLNLRALAVFANEAYKDDDCALFMPSTLDDNIYDPVDSKLVAKMHKAITVIQLKLEGQLIKKHPEWEMQNRDLFSVTNFEDGTVCINNNIYKLKDTNFPTIDKSNPLSLTSDEQELMTILSNSFSHCEKLNKHIKYIYSKGSMYKVCNNNLLFHGCIPMSENSELQEVRIKNDNYSGKDLFDKVNKIVNTAYFSNNSNEKDYAVDFMWYLWCGPKSPLYGKDKMALFERYFIDDKELWKENYNSYYTYSEDYDVCVKILNMFGISSDTGHIINSHVPVKIKDGENPVKANGKLYVIDGGISKAYQASTGIAGYTLIYDSHSLNLAEHKPFISGMSEQSPTIKMVERLNSRANVSDTDIGEELLNQINALRELIDAYRNGIIKEKD